jgi:type I restriction enzyme S subunit
MSTIDELIERLCPSGVSNRSLGALEGAGIIKLGRGNVISKTDLQQDPGDYPVYSSSAVGTGEFGRYGKFMFEDERITWSVDGGGKFFYRPAHRYSVTNVCGWLTVSEPNIVQTKFLFYSLINAWAKKTYNYTVKAHPSVIRVDYELSIPPLEVQQEIVRILDTFTELEAELEAELEVRKKQYEHYRNTLLSFPDGNVQRVPLGEFAELIRGNGLPKSDFTELGVPAIHYGQIYTHYKTWATETKSFVAETTSTKLAKVLPGDLVITNTSENLEDVGKAVAWLGSRTAVTGGHATVIRHKQNPKYLAYYFQTSQFSIDKAKHAKGTKVIDVSAKDLAKISVPLPAIEVQDKIVKILDGFELLTRSLSEGIPAEIEARRKQYEHYRDMLLTFKELAA